MLIFLTDFQQELKRLKEFCLKTQKCILNKKYFLRQQLKNSEYFSFVKLRNFT